MCESSNLIQLFSVYKRIFYTYYNLYYLDKYCTRKEEPHLKTLYPFLNFNSCRLAIQAVKLLLMGVSISQ